MSVSLDATIIVAMITSMGSLVGVIITATLQRSTQRAIKTNHGSKNLGDAVDKLTEKVIKIDVQQEDNSQKLEHLMGQQFEQKILLKTHIRDNHRLVEWGWQKMREELSGEADQLSD